ncbi:MAG: hypothetical protein J07HQW2_03481 [Haloquadratum walsbyi J07HQW2]|uniref:Uncharacterized protein n=2 Tax=Haloquadratum walsbyi TaxID=293091 RepID=U1NIH4_9EURY|nr:MAG: hypothetical protein J07HQW2_03481 [Haloquadratum walsbyi J07HQW2]
MKRRMLIRTVVGTIAIGSTAGCIRLFQSDQSPPPRKSNVIGDISVMSDAEALEVTTAPAESQWVMTRQEIDTASSQTQAQAQAQIDNTDTHIDWDQLSITEVDSSLDSVSPIGTAEAAKGRGATGRGRGGFSSAPRTSNGRAWYGGGAYAATWYNDHDDDVSRVPVTIDTLGIGFIGDNDTFTERSPGPGPINWETTYDDPAREVRADLGPRRGWYRVGAEVNAELAEGGTRSLGWESIDFRVQSDGSEEEITKTWKVSPRI